ncbi:hypothetical protein LUZ61_013523 [Rhynchospora tenuis]|uniref:DUF7787 domain-containing protein n=1 Tax=Rhynchospora tenuis TaxID=198213 RepID=A0AAD5W9P5_9POAL|nr:hypothetical protein LUZ61_013523 [Rhynchospora tenuis]
MPPARTSSRSSPPPLRSCSAVSCSSSGAAPLTMEPFRLQKQLRFEDYLSLFQNGCADHLTVSQLNQIVFIHGFVKLWQHTKVDVIDAVSSLHLIPPTRSTICVTAGIAQLSISCMPTLSLSELKKGIQEIEWQECPVGSVVSVNPVVLHTSDEPISPVSCLTALPGQDVRCCDIVR